MNLHLETVSYLLWESLQKLMSLEELKQFRLVGGTSLSLQLGHRMSVDIDLFTDAEYGSIDFERIEDALQASFPYVDNSFSLEIGGGKCYFIGNDESEQIKLDIMYSQEAFCFPLIEENGVRLANKQEISAMKLDVISRGGRKKDFWDIHELLEHESIHDLLDHYVKRNPYGDSKKELIPKLIDFNAANSDPDPECLRGYLWELIRLDFEDLVKTIKD